MTAEQTPRERVEEWLGRGAPAKELNVVLRSALREVVLSPLPADDREHVGLLAGTVPESAAPRLPWPRDPVPGSEDDFAHVSVDYVLTAHVYTDGNDADLVTFKQRAQSLFDPRLPMRPQIAEDLAPAIEVASDVLHPVAMKLAYGPTGAPRNASVS